jgi:Photosynthetic reaction centre cytochrome C subunit
LEKDKPMKRNYVLRAIFALSSLAITGLYLTHPSTAVSTTRSNSRTAVWFQNPQQPAPTPEDKPAEEVFKNIQVLKGVPASRVRPAMFRVAGFLGVKCSYCHVPEQFEKDDLPTKATARKMFLMVRTIGAEIGNPNKVSCFTCHRGKPKPEPPPEEIMPPAEAMAKANQDKRPAETVYKNIQSLKGTPAARLMLVMSIFSESLGVDCGHCHVEDQFDKDDKPAKLTARKMIHMADTVAKDYFNGAREVTCYTCHRGSTEPVFMPPPPRPKPEAPTGAQPKPPGN